MNSKLFKKVTKNEFKISIIFLLIVFSFSFSLYSLELETEIRKEYNKKGQIKSEKSYIKDTNTKHGEVIYYSLLGKIIKKENYKDNKLHGEVISYAKNGNINKKKITKTINYMVKL